MTDVLVATSAGRSEAAVSAVADAVALVAHSRVRRIDLDTAPNGERGAAILLLREMDKPATALSVLARDEPTPSTWQRVVRDAVKPVVVVPEAEELATPMISRVLVPLDGTPEAAAAVSETVGLFAGAGVLRPAKRPAGVAERDGGQQVVDAAATEGVDLITLGWSQRLDPGRALTLRRTVLEAAVPVMLVPLAAR